MREELELFAHNLDVFMNKYGYNQTTLANKLEVGVTTVADWVHGRKFPRIDKMNKLCEVFHCKPSDLIEERMTKETIRLNEMENRLSTYIKKLNADGYSNLLRYLEDMNPKFFKDGDEDVQ